MAMFDPRRHFDQAEDALTEQLASGDLSVTEYNAEMRELQRDYQALAEEAAQDAYEAERERW